MEVMTHEGHLSHQRLRSPGSCANMNTLCPGDRHESSDEYYEENDTHCPLAELLEQFWQIKDQFASLKSTTHQSTSTAELTLLTDKLQDLMMTLQ